MARKARRSLKDSLVRNRSPSKPARVTLIQGGMTYNATHPNGVKVFPSRPGLARTIAHKI